MTRLSTLSAKCLTGEVSRSVLARRSEFLERGNFLKRRYLQILDKLLIQGLPKVGMAETYRKLSFQEGLHSKKDGRTYLTPPTELLELVIKHGHHPAVEQFFEDAAQGRREQWFQEMQERAAGGQPASCLSQLATKLEEDGGVPALVAMCAVIQARLNGFFEEADGDDDC